jgi:hypothetical protein
MRTGSVRFVGLLLGLTLLCTPAVAFGAISGRIVEGVGVKTAKLGLHDTTDARRIGGSYKRVTDNDYAAYTVYMYYFGKKSGGHYGLEMVSWGKSRHVFAFTIYSTRLVTKRGVHVGSSAAYLAKRYGSTLKKDKPGPVYTQYHMGTRSGRTEFWVRGGKVHHIVIQRY